MITVIAVVVNK